MRKVFNQKLNILWAWPYTCLLKHIHVQCVYGCPILVSNVSSNEFKLPDLKINNQHLALMCVCV